LIMLNPVLFKNKIWPTIKLDFFIKCMVWDFQK
jgi:hypothetical protein